MKLERLDFEVAELDRLAGMLQADRAALEGRMVSSSTFSPLITTMKWSPCAVTSAVFHLPISITGSLWLFKWPEKLPV